jgi:hypothetical protein
MNLTGLPFTAGSSCFDVTDLVLGPLSLSLSSNSELQSFDELFLGGMRVTSLAVTRWHL